MFMRKNKEPFDIEKYNYDLASKFKCFFNSFVNFLFIFFFLFLTFTFGVGSIVNNTSYAKNYAKDTEICYSILKESSLYLPKADGNGIEEAEESARTYIKTLIKTTYYHEGLTYVLDGVTYNLKDTDCLDYHDNIAEYFLNKRPNFTGEEVETPYSFYSSILEWTSYSEYFVPNLFKEGMEYPKAQKLLTKEAAVGMHDYLNEGNLEYSNIYNKLLTTYVNAVNKGYEGMVTKCEPYKVALDALVQEQKSIFTIYYISILGLYVVSIAIYFLLIPAILGDGRTLGNLITKTCYCPMYKDQKISFKTNLIRFLLFLVTQSGILSVAIVTTMLGSVAYSTSYFGFSTGIPIIICFIISVVAFVYYMISRKNQGIADVVSKVVLIDRNSYVLEEIDVK